MADTLGPKGRVPVPCCSQISEGYLKRAPGVKQAATGSREHVHTELGNSDTASPARGARMPARGTEGGGGVVVKCQPVTGWTGRRSARKATDLSRPPKSESALSNEFLFSSTVGVLMRRVVPRSGARSLRGCKQIRGASTESRVRRNAPARFGTGERLRSPTYRYGA
jgi:hypothetical protein